MDNDCDANVNCAADSCMMVILTVKKAIMERPLIR